MAIDMSKYKADKTKQAEERMKPIFILVNESIIGNAGAVHCKDNAVERNAVAKIVTDIINNLHANGIHGLLTIISFGDEVHLRMEPTRLADVSNEQIQELYKDINGNGDEDAWKISRESVFGTSLLLTKDVLQDQDCTPANIYNPAVFLVTTKELSYGWQDILNEVNKEKELAGTDYFAIRADFTADHPRYYITKGVEALSKEDVNKIITTNFPDEQYYDRCYRWNESRRNMVIAGSNNFDLNWKDAGGNSLFVDGNSSKCYLGENDRLSQIINGLIQSFTYNILDRDKIVNVASDEEEAVPSMQSAVSDEMIDPATRV